MAVRGTLTAGNFLCGTGVHSDTAELSGRVADVFSIFVQKSRGVC